MCYAGEMGVNAFCALFGAVFGSAILLSVGMFWYKDYLDKQNKVAEGTHKKEDAHTAGEQEEEMDGGSEVTSSTGVRRRTRRAD